MALLKIETGYDPEAEDMMSDRGRHLVTEWRNLISFNQFKRRV